MPAGAVTETELPPLTLYTKVKGGVPEDATKSMIELNVSQITLGPIIFVEAEGGCANSFPEKNSRQTTIKTSPF
jgi:hypothetical protein